jgi:hypothetical protein
MRIRNSQALFGQPSIVASSFFGPINDNLFGAGGLTTIMQLWHGYF